MRSDEPRTVAAPVPYSRPTADGKRADKLLVHVTQRQVAKVHIVGVEVDCLDFSRANATRNVAVGQQGALWITGGAAGVTNRADIVRHRNSILEGISSPEGLYVGE